MDDEGVPFEGIIIDGIIGGVAWFFVIRFFAWFLGVI